jgi:hypothetical protein
MVSELYMLPLDLDCIAAFANHDSVLDQAEAEEANRY